MIEKKVELDDLSDLLRSVYDYWRARGGDDLRCSWRGFHLEELPAAVLPTTLVVDVKEDPAANVYRFWGSSLKFIHGADLTGRTTAELEPPEMAKIVHATHAATVRTGKPSCSLFGFTRHGGFDHHHTALRLPLSDDGTRVTHIVVAIDLTATGWADVDKQRGEAL